MAMVFCMCFSARERTFVLNPTKDRNGRAQRRTRARLMILKTSPAAVIVVAIVAMTTDISI